MAARATRSATTCARGAHRSDPKTSGWSPGARRRVRGLRREELATLAGISSEYYLRLEQGRDKNPSAQILDALARALQLDIKGTEYLHQLASPPAADGEQPDLETAADGLEELIDQFSMPAIVASRCLDVLAANAVARALSPGFGPGRTSCAGGWWSLPPANSSSIGTTRPTSRSAGCGKRPAAHPDDPRYARVDGRIVRRQCTIPRTLGPGRSRLPPGTHPYAPPCCR